MTVAFDTLGVPHIRAANLDDALFVQGMSPHRTGCSRWTLLRRFNGGELAEVFGPNASESDRESRRLRLRRIAEDAYVTLPAGGSRRLRRLCPRRQPVHQPRTVATCRWNSRSPAMSPGRGAWSIRC